MRRRVATLEVICARLNPGLALLALALGILDLSVAGQRWAATAPAAARSGQARPAIAALPSASCTPALPPELRDMLGRD